MSFQPVVDALTKIVFDIINFIPRFVNGLIILIVGYLISRLVRWVVRVVLRQIHFDQLADRTSITNALETLGVRIPLSAVIAQVVFFFLLLSFATSAVGLMGLTAVADLLQSVLRFVPRAISAGIIIIFGSMLARLLGATITAVAENVNITYGKVLGKIIEYAVLGHHRLRGLNCPRAVTDRSFAPQRTLRRCCCRRSSRICPGLWSGRA